MCEVCVDGPEDGQEGVHHKVWFVRCGGMPSRAVDNRLGLASLMVTLGSMCS